MSSIRGLGPVYLLSLLLLALLAATMSVSSTTPSADPDVVRYPIDLYFLVDKSGSISEFDWRRIVSFANQLQLRMAELAGGYYTSAASDGLRVAITSFACGGKQASPIPTAEDFITGPTGDITVINDGIRRLGTKSPDGGTCPSKGLQRFNTSITASRGNEEPRPTAVIILTDGDIWQKDLPATTAVAKSLRGQDEVYMFGINYGGGSSVTKQWNGLVGDPTKVFNSKDLDQVSKILSVIMLGRITVNFVPSVLQRSRVANFTANTTSTVCLGENAIPLGLYGRFVNLFQASGLVCDMMRLETNQSFLVTPVMRDGIVFCDVPGSLSRKVVGTQRFEQTFRLRVDSNKNGQRTNLFNVPFVSTSVVVCLKVNFRGSSPVGQDNCFPPADPTNSSFGTLEIVGPTVESSDAFYCRFDSVPNRVLAVRKGSVLECLAPGVDVSTALLAGGDPTPFSRFLVETSQGGILMDSSIDSTSFTPVSCIATRNDTKNLEYCWNQDEATSPSSNAIFEGKSLQNLINAYDNLEFTCLYTFNGQARPVPASLKADTVVCDRPPVKEFFQSKFPLKTETRMLTVALRVRSSKGLPTRTGWWAMKTDTAFPVSVSPCLDSTLPPSGVCLGDAFSLEFTGNGIQNFLSSTPSKCYFLSSTNEVLRIDPVAIVAGDGSCAMQGASARLARVTIKDGTGVQILHDIALAPKDNSSSKAVVPCFDIETINATVPFCWGAALSEQEVRITGKSLDYYKNAAKLPTCKFALGDTPVSKVQTKLETDGSLTCAVPRSFGFGKVPFVGDLEVSVEDDAEQYSVKDDEAPVRIQIQSCVRRVRTKLDQRDQNKPLPACAPDCCLRKQTTIRFEGKAVEDITVCDWLSENGTVVAVTTPLAGSKVCSVPDWNPPQTTSVLPAVKVIAYANAQRQFPLGESDLDERTVCVYGDFSAKEITLGKDLRIAFQGPTVREVLDSFAVKCALLNADGNVTRVVNASVGDEDGFTCDLDKMYDSVQQASLGLYLFPKDLGGFSTTAAPTKRPSAPRRRLRQLLVDAAAQEDEEQLRGGTELFVQPLQDVQVSSQMTSEVDPSQCIGQSLFVNFSGPGVAVLRDQVNCSFVIDGKDGNGTSTLRTVVQRARFDNDTNGLSCGITMKSTFNVSYNATILRNDNNQAMAITEGYILSCLVVPPPVPAAANTSDALGVGAIIGIVVGLLALLLVLVLAVLYDKNQKDKRRRKRRAAEAATAAAQAAKDRDNAPEESFVAVPVAVEGASDMSAKSEEDEDIINKGGEGRPSSPVPPMLIPLSEAAQRKFRIGDCVQVLDTIDDSWRYTFVRNLAPNNEYQVEDERLPVPESRIRWPTYSPGEAVEARRKSEDDGGEWLPGVVAFVDPELGTVRLMGEQGDIPFGRVRPAPFQVGENVEERGPDGEWRPAVVMRCEPDGSYVVDGAGGLGLNRSRKRLRWPQFHGGDIVEVRSDGQWKRATVVTTEGGVVVGLEDGLVEPKRFANIDVRRPLTVKTSLDSLATPAPVGDEGDSPRRKFKKREPLDFHELPDFCFEITVDKSQGMGVRFGWTRDQQVVVQKFLGLPGMDAGPLEASEVVSLGDQLLAVNGVSMGGVSFAEVTDIIRTSPDRITLKFGRWRETVKMKNAPPPLPKKDAGLGSKSDNAKKQDMSLV